MKQWRFLSFINMHFSFRVIDMFYLGMPVENCSIVHSTDRLNKKKMTVMKECQIIT